MNEKLTRQISFILLAVSVIAGLFAMFCFLEVNRIRADEFLSFLHSDPAFHPVVKDVWKNIYNGADNSYVHAVALQKWFCWYGANIVVQRSLSLLFWVTGGVVLWLIMKRYEKTLLQRSLFWVLIQFSNMGFLLAGDGRFYSIHYFTALSIFFVINRYVEDSRSKWLYGLVFIAMFALLNSALSIVLLSVLMLALLLLLIRKTIPLNTFLALTGAVTLPVLIYFSVFRITHFHNHFSNWLFQKSGSDDLALSEFISTPFRFFANAKLPLLPDAAGVAVTLILLAGLVFIFRKKHQPDHAKFLLVNEGIMLIVIIMVLQIALHLAFSWPLWPYRYYAGVFWLLPLWFFIRTDIASNKKAALTALLVCLCINTRMIDEVFKVKQRLKEIPGPVTQQTIYKEEFENYAALAKMGEQYIRYPETRNLLVLKPDSLSVKRNAYFFLLKQQGDDLRTR